MNIYIYTVDEGAQCGPRAQSTGAWSVPKGTNTGAPGRGGAGQGRPWGETLGQPPGGDESTVED